MIVDKPSGVLVIPTPKKETTTLTHLLNQELDRRGVEVNAYPCHRIDRETSGIVIYAKGKSAQRKMMEEFKQRLVRKSYIAFVQGIVRKDQGALKGYLFNRNKHKNELMITNFQVLQRRKDFSVLELQPLTGRKNQIRIQCKELGHPLLGEDVYAFRKDFQLRFKRLALHAQGVEFTHPVTGQMVSLKAPLPEDMAGFLAKKL